MNRLWSLTASLVLVLAAGPVQAEWEEVGKIESGAMVSADSERYSRQGDAVTAVARVQYATKQPMPFSSVKYDSAENVYHFHCADQQMVVAETALLDGGNTVHSTKPSATGGFAASARPLPVPAAGIERLAFDWACKRKTQK